jgi:peptidoglycan/xylan/chitin deacetylase (PgdA/CDA1 family)
MTKKTSMIANLCIAGVLLVLSLAVFTTNLSDLYLSVSAPLYNGNKNEKNVSIMINIYWGTEFVAPMMEILRSKGVKATFFLGGTWVSDVKNIGLVKEMARDFEVGHHAYTHKDMKNMPEANQKIEIGKTHELVKALTGVDMHLFAPPSGSFGKTTLKVAESLGYTTIMWTKDTIDWRDQDERVYTRAVNNPAGGDLILMHPTKKTLECLPRIIDFYKNSGFGLVEVSKCIV